MFGTISRIIKEHSKYWRQVLFLAKIDKDKLFSNSDLGWVWALCKPGMRIAVYYIAMSIGFKSSKDIPNIHCPYFLWLVTGLLVWFYMSAMIGGGAACFKRYKAIVKKVQFPVSTIPSIVTLSNFRVHLIIVGVVLVMYPLMGCMPTIYWLELPFYMLAMIFFTYCWSLATGFLAVVSNDFHNVLKTITSAVFWLSAIIFDMSKVKNRIARIFFMFNPVTYVVNGYRNALCKNVWFFDEPENLGCFCLVTLFMLLVSLKVYKSLNKKLPDLL